MKLLSIALNVGLMFAEQPPPKFSAPPESKETLELRTENQLLKAQLQQIQLEYAYAMKVCSMPDLMQARIAALQAEEQAKKAKEPSK